MTATELILAALLAGKSVLWIVVDFIRFDPERRGD